MIGIHNARGDVGEEWLAVGMYGRCLDGFDGGGLLLVGSLAQTTRAGCGLCNVRDVIYSIR